jgi:hypothetical protein
MLVYGESNAIQWKVTFYAFFARSAWKERIMGWSRLSVRKIQLKNHWKAWNEIWCGGYAIGDYSKIVLSNLLRLVVTKWRMSKLVRWDPHKRHLLTMVIQIVVVTTLASFGCHGYYG